MRGPGTPRKCARRTRLSRAVDVSLPQRGDPASAAQGAERTLLPRPTAADAASRRPSPHTHAPYPRRAPVCSDPTRCTNTACRPKRAPHRSMTWITGTTAGSRSPLPLVAVFEQTRNLRTRNVSLIIMPPFTVPTHTKHARTYQSDLSSCRSRMYFTYCIHPTHRCSYVFYADAKFTLATICRA